MKNEKYKKSLCFIAVAFCLLFSHTMNLNANMINSNHLQEGQTENSTNEYLNFGTYPQTEITDKTIIEAIEGAATGQENTSVSICVMVDGIKYSRIIADNQPHYYKWEPIKWKILENNGKTLFVVADKVLDCKKYNETKAEITWEKSTLRSWLNAYGSEQNLDGVDYSTVGFLQTAFTGEEKDAIARTTLTNSSNEGYETAGGNDTADSVFLLSKADVTCEKYGFSANQNASTADRQAVASDYACAMGITRSPAAGMEENCDWWLRMPGMYGYDSAYVNFSGYLNQKGLLVSYEGIGVRPALYINLPSDDDTESGGDKDESARSGKQEQQPVMIEKLTIKAPSKKLAAGKKVKLTLSIMPENADDKAIMWKTSNKKYATVDNNGKVTLKKAGAGKTVTITAMAKDGSGKKASIKIKIMKHAVKTIKLKAPSKTLKAGKSMKLEATIKTTGKSVNKTIKWKSSNIKYAKVTTKGKVTAKKAGKGRSVTITAASTDGSNKKAKVKIKIE